MGILNVKYFHYGTFSYRGGFVPSPTLAPPYIVKSQGIYIL
jgi:hypothetical protein